MERTLSADLVWMDLEMTGLDPKCDRIIEIATLITDDELNILAEGPVFAIRQTQDLFDGMDNWNQKHHSESGLLARIKAEGVAETEAEAMTLAFLEEHVAKGASPLFGNTIWQDRRFLSRYMPTLESYLHYRMIDVSSVKELAHRWRPDIFSSFQKKNEHTALADIYESVEELRHYKTHFFQLQEES